MTDKVSTAKKIKISVYSGLLFLVIASPFMYNIVNSLTHGLGVFVLNQTGCPTYVGVILHAVVFTLLTFGMMYLPLPGVDDDNKGS
jgi:hypothetical protein